MPPLLPEEHQAEPRRVCARRQGRGPHRPQVQSMSIMISVWIKVTLNQGILIALNQVSYNKKKNGFEVQVKKISNILIHPAIL